MHDPRPDKDVVAFKVEMDRVLEASCHHDSPFLADCAGWVFPVDVTLTDEYWGLLDFTRAVFCGRLRLDDVKGRAVFSDARFLSSAMIHDGRLDVDFDRCDFQYGLTVEQCTLYSASFRGATFRGDARFDQVEFSTSASFSDAAFHASFFVHQTDFGPIRSQAADAVAVVANFSSVRWLQPAFARFSRVNRRSPQPFIASFANCSSLEGVTFVDVKWRQVADRLVLWDEMQLPVALTYFEAEDQTRFYRPTDHEVVAVAYRQLAAAFEERRAFDLAEECLIGVMEMKRRDKSLPWWARVAIELYGLASEYGSNYYRALKILLAAVLLAFPTLYLHPWLAVTPVEPSQPRPTLARFSVFDSEATRIWKNLGYGAEVAGDAVYPAVVFSVETVTFARMPAYRASTPLCRLVAAAETVFVAGEAGLFLLALRRRFRH